METNNTQALAATTPGCSETGLAGAVTKAVGMLAQLDLDKLPLAVAGVLGVLRCGLAAAAADGWTSADAPPDDDTLVLLVLSDSETWPGFRDGGTWRYVTAEPIESAKVIAWMHMPPGPAGNVVASVTPAACPAGAACYCQDAHPADQPQGEPAAQHQFRAVLANGNGTDWVDCAADHVALELARQGYVTKEGMCYESRVLADFTASTDSEKGGA